jgi:hypothetical protein
MGTVNIKHAQQAKERGVSVKECLNEADKMLYDSIFIVGVKDGELSAHWSTSSSYELLGAIELGKNCFREHIE